MEQPAANFNSGAEIAGLPECFSARWVRQKRVKIKSAVR
jgi:hypothetical protein